MVDVSLPGKSHLKPIRIAKGALGPDYPSADLFVSPNHRILVSKPELEVLFDVSDVLVPAKFLLDLPGVESVADAVRVTYFHFIFDKHEIVISNGACSESLYPGDIALNGMEKEALDEIREIFPDIMHAAGAAYGTTAAKVLKKHEASLLSAQYLTAS
jgi:hypothetical protein